MTSNNPFSAEFDRLASRKGRAPIEEIIELATPPIPHVATFQGFASTVARTYFPNDEAIRNAWSNQRLMRNDPSVAECIETRKRSVALLDWRVLPDDPRSERQKEAAAITERIIRRTPRYYDLVNCLLDAIWFGKAGAMTTWARKTIGGSPYFCIGDWTPVNGDKIVYKVEDGRAFERPKIGIRIGMGALASKIKETEKAQIGATDMGAAYFLDDFQMDRFIVHSHDIEDGTYDDPYSGGAIHGVGIRSRIFWTWFVMKEAEAWLMEFMERSATGFEMWHYPSGDEKARQEILKAVQERRNHSGNIVLVPMFTTADGAVYDCRRIEPSMEGAHTLVEIIQDFYRRLIKRYILGQTLTTETGATGLGSNLASIHLETFLQLLKADATRLEETLTAQLVEKIRKFNFPELDENALRYEIVTKEVDAEQRLRYFQEMYHMGLPIAESDLREATGVRAPEKGEPTLVNPSIDSFRLQQKEQENGAE